MVTHNSDIDADGVPVGWAADLGDRLSTVLTVSITPEETKVLDLLVETANAFFKLPSEHPDATTEFRTGIHVLQNQMAGRIFFRALNAHEGG